MLRVVLTYICNTGLRSYRKSKDFSRNVHKWSQVSGVILSLMIFHEMFTISLGTNILEHLNMEIGEGDTLSVDHDFNESWFLASSCNGFHKNS